MDLEVSLSALAMFDHQQLNNALGRLRELQPKLKQQLLEACAAVALADGSLHPDQHALLHGIAATLDCPLPLVGQDDIAA